MEDTMLSRCLTHVRSLIKTGVLLGSIALVMTPAAPALAASGPYQVLYIFPGAYDNGGAPFAGVATAVHCFSFSPNSENIQFVVRTANGAQVGTTSSYTMASFQTLTISTHTTLLYNSVSLDTGLVYQGVIGITATSTNIVCTAQVVDASAAAPNGFDLHGTRFNPISGSQE